MWSCCVSRCESCKGLPFGGCCWITLLFDKSVELKSDLWLTVSYGVSGCGSDKRLPFRSWSKKCLPFGSCGRSSLFSDKSLEFNNDFWLLVSFCAHVNGCGSDLRLGCVVWLGSSEASSSVAYTEEPVSSMYQGCVVCLDCEGSAPEISVKCVVWSIIISSWGGSCVTELTLGSENCRSQVGRDGSSDDCDVSGSLALLGDCDSSGSVAVTIVPLSGLVYEGCVVFMIGCVWYGIVVENACVAWLVISCCGEGCGVALTPKSEECRNRLGCDDWLDTCGDVSVDGWGSDVSAGCCGASVAKVPVDGKFELGIEWTFACPSVGWGLLEDGQLYRFGMGKRVVWALDGWDVVAAITSDCGNLDARSCLAYKDTKRAAKEKYKQLQHNQCCSFGREVDHSKIKCLHDSYKICTPPPKSTIFFLKFYHPLSPEQNVNPPLQKWTQAKLNIMQQALF